MPKTDRIFDEKLPIPLTIALSLETSSQNIKPYFTQTKKNNEMCGTEESSPTRKTRTLIDKI